MSRCICERSCGENRTNPDCPECAPRIASWRMDGEAEARRQAASKGPLTRDEIVAVLSSPLTETDQEHLYASSINGTLAAIQSELDYQDAMWGKNLSGRRPLPDGVPSGFRTADEWALYIRQYAEQAAALATRTDDPAAIMDIFRKITTMGFRAMRQHGAPMRVGTPTA